MGEVALVLFALLQRTAPETALLGITTLKCQDHRQGDLAIAEVVADALAEHHLARAVVEHVVDQLEGDAEILAVATQRFDFGGERSPPTAPIWAAAANRVAVLAVITSR